MSTSTCTSDSSAHTPAITTTRIHDPDTVSDIARTATPAVPTPNQQPVVDHSATGLANPPEAAIDDVQPIIEDRFDQDRIIRQGDTSVRSLTLVAVIMVMIYWWFLGSRDRAAVVPRLGYVAGRVTAMTTYLMSTITFVLQHVATIHDTLSVIEHAMRDIRDVAGPVILLVNLTADAYPRDANNGTDIQAILEV